MFELYRLYASKLNLISFLYVSLETEAGTETVCLVRTPGFFSSVGMIPHVSLKLLPHPAAESGAPPRPG